MRSLQTSFKVAISALTTIATALPAESQPQRTLVSAAGQSAILDGDASGTSILFAFTAGGIDESNWKTWDWGNITHLGFWSNPSDDLRAQAASHNVKLFQDCSTPDKTTWGSSSDRAAFAEKCASQISQNKLDGVFFDFEGTGLTASQKNDYTTLAQTVSAKIAPKSLFICVGGRPSYENRDYDYAGLAKAADFLFVMMYDMHLYDDYTCMSTSQGNICSPAEASIRAVQAGTEEYLKIVPANKLVMGFPWYGQRYTQVAVPINEGQIDYKDVLAVMDSGVVVKQEFDKDSDSQTLTCKAACEPGKKGGKIWFDDATTLKAKYAVAVSAGLRGIGMWSADKLPTPENGQDPHFAQRNAMWVTVSAAKAGLDDRAAPVQTSGSTSAALQGKLFATSEKYPSTSAPDRLAESDVTFNATLNSALPTLSVHPATPLQPILGFGGAITEAVATVFGQLPQKLQDEVVEALWGPTGQRYSLGRTTIGSTDFSVSVYSYNDHSGDLEQRNFTIDHDERNGVHDLIRRASKAAMTPPVASPGGIEWLASPWSPPGWMKQGWMTPKGYMRNSAKPGMIQDDKLFASYALYTSKYLSAMKSAGINISRVTIQNEPDSADHMFPVAYPACNFNGTDEGDYLRRFLGPQLRADHPDIEIYIHDGQKFHDVPIADRVDAIVKAANGTEYIDGVAFHWYGNNLDNYNYLADLHAKYPSLSLLASEATLQDPRTQGGKDWDEGMKYMVDIIGDLNNGATGWIEWNVLLDTTGGPTCIGPTATTFCTPEVGHCDAPILADTKKGTLEYRPTYHIMAHVSRFIPRGSRVVSLTQTPTMPVTTGLSAVGVLTPNNDLVVVAMNPDPKNPVEYQVVVDVSGASNVLKLSLPPNSVHTVVVPLAPSKFV